MGDYKSGDWHYIALHEVDPDHMLPAAGGKCGERAVCGVVTWAGADGDVFCPDGSSVAGGRLAGGAARIPLNRSPDRGADATDAARSGGGLRIRAGGLRDTLYGRYPRAAVGGGGRCRADWSCGHAGAAQSGQ